MGKAFPVSKCQAEHRYGDENSSNWSLDSQKMLFLPVIIAYTRHALAIPAAAGRLTSEWKASKNASAAKPMASNAREFIWACGMVRANGQILILCIPSSVQEMFNSK